MAGASARETSCNSTCTTAFGGSAMRSEYMTFPVIAAFSEAGVTVVLCVQAVSRRSGTANRHAKDRIRCVLSEHCRECSLTSFSSVSQCRIRRRIFDRSSKRRDFWRGEIWEGKLFFVPPFLHLLNRRFSLLIVDSGITSEINRAGWKSKSGPSLIHDAHDPKE